MSKKEIRKFDAEVGKILHLMIHSLYTNKDIFLRELVSNASDACDKLRYESSKHQELASDSPLKITISVDEDARTITIKDNGIGMSKDELIENLGTIAKSGTQSFLERLTGDAKKDVLLIGQFGVGFYSSFMVADEVIVTSRKAGTEEVWTWTSSGTGEFTIEESLTNMDSGTEVTLKLRVGEEDYLDKFRISHIISTYSDHISIPIELIESKDTTRVLNSSSALWSKSKSEISEEQYNEFYKKIAHAGDEPWMVLHNKNEGAIEYTNLLFIPSTKTVDLFHPDRKCRVKLYIKRVFISDDGIDIVPQYLRFLRGVVDSEDLPLNISRETLQHNQTLEKIKKSIVKRLVSELEKKLNDNKKSYLEFWNNFGAVLKEGLCESIDKSLQLLDICLFKSAKTGEFISLDEYIANMKPDQDAIYYLSGEDDKKILTHPQLEGFLQRDIDVLLFTDTVDNFWINVNHQYKEKSIKSVTRSDIDLAKIKTEKEDIKKPSSKDNEKDLEKLLDYFKKTLQGLVADVKVSGKLTDSAVCLSVAEGAMDMRMERFLIEQKQLKSASTKILEINSKHKIIQKISQDIVDDKITDQTENLVKILFDEACVIEGEPVHDPRGFIERMNQCLVDVLKI
jgi:molecular chaperone HtpG